MRCLRECVNPGEKINLLLNLFIWQSCRDRIKNEQSRTCHINTWSHFFCCHRARRVQENPVECTLSFRNAILMLQSHSERDSQRWLAKNIILKTIFNLSDCHICQREIFIIFEFCGIFCSPVIPAMP